MLTATRVRPVNCSHCQKQITTSEYADKTRLNGKTKWLCFHDKRIKTLHDGVMEFIRGITSA